MPQLIPGKATPTTLDIMDHAILEVTLQHHEMLGLGHILTSIMLRPEGSPAGRVLAGQNVSLEKVRRVVRGTYLHYVGNDRTVIPYDHPARDAINLALTIARQRGGASLVRSGDLLQALIEEADEGTLRLFEIVGINQWKVRAELKRASPTDD